jgi:hypothetical protein
MEVTFAAELWEHSGTGAWHFVSVPPEIAEEIRMLAGEPRGFGSVRVEVQLGSSRWATSVFPDSGSGSFVLPVKKAVRLAEGLAAGDCVELRVRIADVG